MSAAGDKPAKRGPQFRYPDAGRMQPYAIRLTADQRAKLERMGGGRAVRDWIDQHQEPKK